MHFTMLWIKACVKCKCSVCTVCIYLMIFFCLFNRAEKTEVLSDDLLQVSTFPLISCFLAIIYLALNGGKLGKVPKGEVNNVK